MSRKIVENANSRKNLAEMAAMRSSVKALSSGG